MDDILDDQYYPRYGHIEGLLPLREGKSRIHNSNPRRSGGRKKSLNSMIERIKRNKSAESDLGVLNEEIETI